MAHEVTLNKRLEPDSSKSKGIVLKATSNDSEDDVSDEMVEFAKRFKQKLFRNQQQKPTFNKKVNSSKPSNSNNRCFKCRESGHMIKDFPTWKEIKSKSKREKSKNDYKKVMLASCWGELETSEDEEEDDEVEANLCLSNLYSDDEKEEVSFLDLKKDVKKLSKPDLITYFEETLDTCHEQNTELKELKTQILDIVEENQILKGNMKKVIKLEKLKKSEIAATDHLRIENDELCAKLSVMSKQLNEKKKNVEPTITSNETEVNALHQRILDMSSEFDKLKISHEFEIDTLNKRFESSREIEHELSKSVNECVKVKGSNHWYLDRGCSRHMTGDISQFLSLEAYNGGSVTFGDNKKGPPSIKFEQDKLCETYTRCKQDEEDEDDSDFWLVRKDSAENKLHERKNEETEAEVIVQKTDSTITLENH
ncbi:hypothetical protein RND81_02G098700 [Saponaria officinalis]|uniref:Retrovirus-related Pol polyprotein from transposon TNT 1-94-like beta-barrel domain-containing protein n=1 Tax=Saponaria officinalis TaxID=3572 RepID=A0AAW1ML17_SAPOF